jgi:predicted nucleic acid-binding protein
LIVLDSSYALALVLPDEQRPASVHAVLAARLSAPVIWPLEVANALRTNLRRQRLDVAGVETICQKLADLQVDVMAASHQQPRRYFDAAQAHDLTPYDATYLVLAQQLSAPLATRDTFLAQAARRAGIPILD